MKKLKRGNVSGIGRHIFRENECYGNENIDTSRSEQNYDFVQSNEKSLRERVFQRIAELGLKRKPRHDAVLLCSHVISLSREDVKRLGKEGCDRYFAASYDFYCKRYGKKNIVAAVVHWDETNPHMHIEHVPVTRGGILSAKKLFSRVKDPKTKKIVRNDLQDLQDDFFLSVGKEMGLERGIPSDIKHLNERAYKEKKYKEFLRGLSNQEFDAIQELEEAQTSNSIVAELAERDPDYFCELYDAVKAERGREADTEGQEQGKKPKAKDEGNER